MAGLHKIHRSGQARETGTNYRDLHLVARN